MIGFGAVVLQAFLGILFGLLAGYLGGKVDAVLMRIADVQLSFSTLMVAIIVGAVFKASFGNLMFGEIAIYMLIFIIGVAEAPDCPDRPCFCAGGEKEGIRRRCQGDGASGPEE